MRAVWKVTIQPPNLDATEELGDFVGTEYIAASKYHKKRWNFETRGGGGGVRETAGLRATELDVSKRVISIVVEQSDRKVHMAKITMFDHDHYLADTLETGLLVTVSGGWDEEGSEGRLFEGLIHVVSPVFKSGNRSTITLTCLEKMIVLAAVEVDLAKVKEPSLVPGTGDYFDHTNLGKEDGDDGDSPEDKDVEKASAEAGGYADIIIATARRNGLQCNLSDITLTEPYPTNKINSPKQTAKATDLAHLYKLAKDLYAAMWVDEDNRLKFSSLTSIYDTKKPELTFVFRDVGSEEDGPWLRRISADASIFDTANTKRVYVESAAVNKGRPRKKAKVEAETGVILAEDITGAPTVTDDGREIIAYKVNSEMLAALDATERDKIGDVFTLQATVGGTIDWDTTQQYLLPITLEHVPESQEVDGTDKVKVQKADPRELNIGVDMECTAGYWGIRPITMATVHGLGTKYSGTYYIAQVSHMLSNAGYKCSVKALKIGV